MGTTPLCAASSLAVFTPASRGLVCQSSSAAYEAPGTPKGSAWLILIQPASALCSRPIAPALRSFKRAGQPGRLTRLLSCSDEKLKEYKWLDIVPTFVVPDIEYDEDHDDHYTAYNKPFSIAYLLCVGDFCDLHLFCLHSKQMLTFSLQSFQEATCA